MTANFENQQRNSLSSIQHDAIFPASDRSNETIRKKKRGNNFMLPLKKIKEFVLDVLKFLLCQLVFSDDDISEEDLKPQLKLIKTGETIDVITISSDSESEPDGNDVDMNRSKDQVLPKGECIWIMCPHLKFEAPLSNVMPLFFR